MIAIGALWTTRYVRPLLALGIFWLVLLIVNIKADPLSPWPYLPFFIGGMTMAVLMREEFFPNLSSKLRWDYIVFGILLFIGLCTPSIYTDLTGLHYQTLVTKYSRGWVNVWLFSPLMAFLILGVTQAGILKIVFSHWSLRFIGKISYSLYLIHVLSFRFTKQFLFPEGYLHIFIVSIVSFSIAFFIAWVLYIAIETPANRLGKRLASRIDP